MKKLLVVDDSDEIRKQLKWGLGKDYPVLLAANSSEAIDLFRKNSPKVVTLDLGLPPHEDGTEEGFRCLREMLRIRPHTKIIVITGNEERASALRAVQDGAYDFYQKPVDLAVLKIIIERAFHLCTIEEENRRLNTAYEGQKTLMCGMVGQCPEMLQVFSTIRKIAPSDVSLLVEGESGTGKELVARAIHDLSLRKDSPFIPINCGAIPENLLESELFGHEKGSFTGAHSQVLGKVEYADKGTLFLDEIGELPAHLQVKLLRFLQEKTIQRVGGREDIPLDVRIISATNIDISKAIHEGTFREDLYYRLGVVTVKLPPLRSRGEDIMLLSTIFLRRLNDEFSKKIRGFSAASIELLKAYDWPGNIRELENKIQRAVLMSENLVIEPHDLGFLEKSAVHGAVHPEILTLKEAREKTERDLIITALDKNKGNIAKAAEDLGVSRPTLYDLMKKLSINISAGTSQ